MKRLDKLYLRFHRMTIRDLECRVVRSPGSLEGQRCLIQFLDIRTCDGQDIEGDNAGHEE